MDMSGKPSREELQARWRQWVVAELGSDPVRAAAAATAAADVASERGDFNAAANAARASWAGSNKTNDEAGSATGAAPGKGLFWLSLPATLATTIGAEAVLFHTPCRTFADWFLGPPALIAVAWTLIAAVAWIQHRVGWLAAAGVTAAAIAIATILLFLNGVGAFGCSIDTSGF